MLMSADMEYIEKRFLKVLEKRFNKELAKYLSIEKDQHFLGYKVGLGPSELLYIYFDLEKEFEITISEEHIVSGRFSTFNNIVKIIFDEIQSKTDEKHDMKDSKVS
jgi:acyl carrier protein